MSSQFMKGSPLFWCTDADNTLWDTDAVYRRAQLNLLEGVERSVSQRAHAADRLAFLRGVDQALAEQDHRGLKYPPAMLVCALARLLTGAGVRSAVSEALGGGLALPASTTGDLVSRYQEELLALPPLREGVRQGLELLRNADASVYVITEGKRERIENTLEEYELSAFVDSIVSAEKTVSLYTRLLKVDEGTAHWMIGDQWDRDVLLSEEAGFKAIFFPGGFRPKWLAQHSNTNKAEAVVCDYFQAAAFTLKHSISEREG